LQGKIFVGAIDCRGNFVGGRPIDCKGNFGTGGVIVYPKISIPSENLAYQKNRNNI